MFFDEDEVADALAKIMLVSLVIATAIFVTIGGPAGVIAGVISIPLTFWVST